MVCKVGDSCRLPKGKVVVVVVVVVEGGLGLGGGLGVGVGSWVGVGVGDRGGGSVVEMGGLGDGVGG